MLHASPVAGGTDQAIDAKSKPATKTKPLMPPNDTPGRIGNNWEGQLWGGGIGKAW